VFDGTHIWTADTAQGKVLKLRASDGALVGTYPIGGTSVRDMLFDGAHIWISLTSDTVRKLRASDGALVGTYQLRAYSMAFDGTHIWGTNSRGRTVSKMRVSDGALVGTYSLGTEGMMPTGVLFDGVNIWVGSRGDVGGALNGYLWKLRPSDGTVVGTTLLSTNPHSPVAFDGIYVWVTKGRNTLETVRASDGKLVGSHTVPSNILDVVFDGTHIWGTSGWNSTDVWKLRSAVSC